MIEPTVAWLGFFTTVVVTVPPFINARVNMRIAKTQEAARQDAETRQAVEQHKVLVLAEKTHTLVNSQYGIALALIVEKAARIYEISKNVADKADLENAKLKLAEHEAKQKVVDEGEQK